MVICALALRLKVVPSLKVRPSDELCAVCTTSLRKISSFGLSGIAVLLRVTVAVPTTAATLPIGSSGTASAAGAAGSGVGAAGLGVAGAAGVGGAGAGKGCGWASWVGSGAAFTDRAGIKPATSTSANENRRHIR